MARTARRQREVETMHSENLRLRSALQEIARRAPNIVIGGDPGSLLAMGMGQLATAALEQSATETKA